MSSGAIRGHHVAPTELRCTAGPGASGEEERCGEHGVMRTVWGIPKGAVVGALAGRWGGVGAGVAQSERGVLATCLERYPPFQASIAAKPVKVDPPPPTTSAFVMSTTPPESPIDAMAPTLM